MPFGLKYSPRLSWYAFWFIVCTQAIQILIQKPSLSLTQNPYVKQVNTVHQVHME